MFYTYLDASALVKRYVIETGTPVVDHLFRRVPQERMIVLSVGLAEVASILVRRRNTGVLTTTQLQQMISLMRNEVGVWAAANIPEIDARLADRAVRFMDRYSINATDAILLRSALDLVIPFRASGNDLLLISCDRRLLHAAGAENLITFNPETQSAAELDTLLGP